MRPIWICITFLFCTVALNGQSQTYKVHTDSLHGFIVYDSKIGLYDANGGVGDIHRWTCKYYTYKETLSLVDSINQLSGGDWHLPTVHQAMELSKKMFPGYPDHQENNVMAYQIKDTKKKMDFNNGNCSDCANIVSGDFWTCNFDAAQSWTFKRMNDSIPCVADFRLTGFFRIISPRSDAKQKHMVFLVKDF